MVTIIMVILAVASKQYSIRNVFLSMGATYLCMCRSSSNMLPRAIHVRYKTVVYKNYHPSGGHMPVSQVHTGADR